MIMLDYYSEDMNAKTRAEQKLNSLISELKKSDDEFLEQKLVSLLYVKLIASEQRGNLEECIRKSLI
jgi:hypothetical protein